MISVEVESPVTIKANGKTIRLSRAEARELASKLNSVLGINYHPIYPWYPVSYETTCNDDGTSTWSAMGNAFGNSAARASSPIESQTIGNVEVTITESDG